LKKLSNLKKIFIDNLKLLRSINGFSKCLSVEEFIYRSGTTRLVSDDFSQIIELPNLKYAKIGTGSIKKIR
jgi:hypothetical protein